jgi:hypothetical protein
MDLALELWACGDGMQGISTPEASPGRPSAQTRRAHWGARGRERGRQLHGRHEPRQERAEAVGVDREGAHHAATALRQSLQRGHPPAREGWGAPRPRARVALAGAPVPGTPQTGAARRERQSTTHPAAQAERCTAWTQTRSAARPFDRRLTAAGGAGARPHLCACCATSSCSPDTCSSSGGAGAASRGRSVIRSVRVGVRPLGWW